MRKKDVIKTNIVDAQTQEAINNFFKINPELSSSSFLPFTTGEGIADGFSKEDAWIQTYSGRRFCPTNPNPKAIVIQDIAHSLSMQCRFGGHSSKFYSVAQHSVGVSYLCEPEDALWGLLHDASEAYLVDIPSPIKTSGKFDAYLELEKNMMSAVCERFSLSPIEPVSVKRADRIMLSIEAKQLMHPLREDWEYTVDSLPLNLDPLNQADAKELFLKRFFELQGLGKGLSYPNL